jgi:hypothetical protein
MKPATLKQACVRFLLLAILLYASSDARAQSGGSIPVHQNALAFASQLIQEGHLVADGKGAWREHRPSPAAENEFIRVHGFAEYAKWHLGLDERYAVNTKRRYKFPYGDFTNIHRCGLLAVKARARQYGYTQIESAAAELQRNLERRATAARSASDHELNTPKRKPIAVATVRHIVPQ